jgi:fructose-1,6-bisphosphatase class II
MSQGLSEHFLNVVERAAIACARTVGQGDRHNSDHVAVEAMRAAMDDVPMDGRIVIGEGERDKAPMLFIGEEVGSAHSMADLSLSYPPVDIAVDPLEGTNLCATGEPNAIAVLAASERGGLLHAPDIYMDKLVVGPRSKEAVSLDSSVDQNLNAISECLGLPVTELVVVVLDRPRHENLISDIRKAGARVRLIGDGDLSAGILAASAGSGVHAAMGQGGAPEGVLAAAAMRCLNGEIFARLVVKSTDQEERMRSMGIDDKDKLYAAGDLASGNSILFAATGVTDGSLMKGVRFVDDGVRTHSLLMSTEPHCMRFIDTIHAQGEGSNATFKL